MITFSLSAGEAIRVMQGWLRIDAEGLQTRAELERWVARGMAYARSLPSKR